MVSLHGGTKRRLPISGLMGCLFHARTEDLGLQAGHACELLCWGVYSSPGLSGVRGPEI